MAITLSERYSNLVDTKARASLVLKAMQRLALLRFVRLALLLCRIMTEQTVLL